MIKKILLLCVLFLGAFYASAQTIVKGAGIIYTNGAPTHTVNVNVDAETAIDTAAGIWYERSRDGLGWIPAGFRIQKFTGSSAPTAAPLDKESEVQLNDVDSLYRWRGGAWRHINKVLVYSAGTGISITGTTITNTGDLSATNEGSLTVLAGTGTTSVIQSNTSGSTNVTITAGTGLSISETGNTITLTNSSPDQTVTLTNGGGISISGTYPNFTLTASVTAAYSTIQEEGTGLTQRSILNFVGSAATAADNVTKTDVTFDSDVNALASTASTGIYVITGTGTSATRTLTGPAAGISVTNGNGVSGNPTLALANDLAALEGLAGTGYAVRTGTDTWAQRTFTAGTGISLTNADGVAGNTTITNSSPDQTVTLTNGGGISITGTYPNFTLTATDQSTTNEVLTVSDGTDSEALGGQTLTFVGAGGASADYDPVTNTLTITAAGGGGGISNLNGLTAGTQSFATGTSGTDFNISSATATHTFNLPTASATNRGALSSADWTTFNNKDGSVTNEGSLTVLAGSGTTSVIQSNTSGSTDVTITAGTGLSISETGNTITLTNSSPDQTVTLTNGGGISISGTYPNFTLTASVTAAYSTIQEEGTGVTQRSTFNFVGSALTAADDVPNTRTNITVDSDVNALASTGTTGLYVITGTGTSATRTLTGPAAGITVSNGNGVSGNPTLALANDLAALEGLAGTGIAVRTAADTWAQRSVVAGTGAITVTNGDGVSGNITVNNTDPDQLATNEGRLTVVAGGANDSEIQSNTSGSTNVVISGTRGVTITESGATITVGLPTSTTNYGLRFDGTNWVSSAQIQNNDAEVGIGGAPITGVELYVNGRGRFDATIETRGTGVPTGGTGAAAVRLINTTAITGDTWYLGSLNDGTFALQSGNAATVLSTETDGTVATAYDFKIGDVTGITPTTIIGRDASGYVGTVAVGSGLSLSGGTLSVTGGGGGNYQTIQEEGTGVTQRPTFNFIGSAATAADDAPNTRTNITFDSDVNALASTASTGIYVITGTGTSATRTLTGPAAGITVTNGDGVSGNPTLALANDLAALEGLAGTGYAVRTAANTWAQRTFTAGTGISLTNADGVAGNTTITNSSPDQTVTLTNGGGISISGTYPNFTLTASVTAAYSTVQEEGVGVTQRSILNFVGSAATAADNVTKTDVTFDSDVNALASTASTGLYVITGTGTSATRTLTGPAAGITVTNGNGVSGNPTLALANDLSALEGLAGTGYAVRTAADTWAQRTFAAGTGISLTNADGVAGNTTITNSAPDQTVTITNGGGISVSGTYPNFTLTAAVTTAYSTIQEEGTGVTQRSIFNFVGSAATAADDVPNTRTNITFDSDINALASTASTGLYVITGTGTSATRTLTGPAAGITVTNGNGVSGNPTLALANDLSALEGLAGTGIAVRTAADTWAQRSVVAGTGAITVTNGDGVSGNITVNNTDPDQSTTNEVLTISDGLNSEAMGGQTLIVSGAGGITTSYNGATNTLTITGSGGGGTPAGSSFQVQYNNAGAFGAEAEFNYDPTNNQLVVGTTTALAALHGRGRNDTGVGVILAENNSGNNILEVKSNGNIKLGDNESYPYFYQSATAGGSVSYTANGITFYSEPTTTSTDVISFFHPSSALTSANVNMVRQTGTWAPSSGTATYNGIVSDPTINQTSTASGRIKLIKGNPTVTQSTGGVDVFSASASITAASGGLRGYYSDINSGTGIYQMYLDGTAISRFDGEVGIKTDPASGFDLHVVGNQRNDARLLIRGTGTPVSSSAASSVAMQNTTAGTGDTWYVGSMNDGTFVLQSGNASTVIKAQTDGTVETIYDLQIDFLNSTPTKVIGVDNSGLVGQVTLGTDVTLSAGELPLWNSNDAGGIVSLTSTALANITGLSFDVTSGKEYEFWAAIKYSAAATTTGSAFSIDCPAGTVQLHVESATANNAQFFHAQNAENTLLASASSAYTSGNIAYVRGIFECTTTGTCILRGATEVNGSAITVQGVSNVNWREIK